MLPALKIGLLVLVFAALAPVQMLATRFRWRLAGRIPVWFHKAARRTLGLRLRQIGAIAAERPLLVVANHSSWLDIVSLGSVAPLSFIAKSEVATWPAVRTLARLQRTIFVDRSKRSATSRMLDAIGARLAHGDPIVLFAEGTTSDGQRVLPYRSALIGAAAGDETDAAGTLIQPVVIAYPRRCGLPVGRAGRAGLAWHGDMDLGPHLWPLLGGGSIDGVIVWGEPRPSFGPGGRKRLAGELEAWARAAYADALHGRI